MFIHRLTSCHPWNYGGHRKQKAEVCRVYPMYFPVFEPSREKRDIMVIRFVVLQMRMRSSLLGWETCVFAWSFLKVLITCLRTAKALARLRLCAVSPEPLLVAFVMSTLFSYACSFILRIYSSHYPRSVFNLDIETDKLQQCRPRSNATERGVRSGSTLFATYPSVFEVSTGTTMNLLNI